MWEDLVGAMKNAIRLRRFITDLLPFFISLFKEILHIQFAQLVKLLRYFYCITVLIAIVTKLKNKIKNTIKHIINIKIYR